MAIALAERGFRVIGIDHSPEMLEIAAAKAARAGLAERIELRNDDIIGADIAPGTADVVTCQGVLHHLEDPWACVEAMARLMRPGASFYISEPCTDATPVGLLLRGGARLALAVRRFPRHGPLADPESVEAPIRGRELLEALDRNALAYDAEFITHIPLAHKLLPDRVRLRIALVLSRPWRRRAGDLVFVEGTRPRGDPPA